MKVNLATVIIHANKTPVKGEGGNDLTVRECLVTLLQFFQAPRKAMFTQYSAGMKCGDDAITEVEFTKKELETVRVAIEANEVQTDKGAKPIYGSWILGQVRQAVGETEEGDS